MPDSLNLLQCWTGRELRPVADVARAPAPLLVADSWLQCDGRTRAVERHWERFRGSCVALGVPGAELDRFRGAVGAALPPTGRWFPRVELTQDGLALRLRPAPPLATAARVLVAAPGDPRDCPRRKGPDLDLLGGLRERARAAGADEALLCDASGALLEGALSSLLWWEEDVLCTTPDAGVLPGVTRALLLQLAGERGVRVRTRAPLPAQLAGREVWLTSALHGIRVVSGWLHPSQEAGDGARAPAWRAQLERFVAPATHALSAVED